jgi:hypothetical protein
MLSTPKYPRRPRRTESGIEIPRRLDGRSAFGRRFKVLCDAMASELGAETLTEADKLAIREAVLLTIAAEAAEAEADPLAESTLLKIAAARRALDGVRRRGAEVVTP